MLCCLRWILQEGPDPSKFHGREIIAIRSGCVSYCDLLSLAKEGIVLHSRTKRHLIPW
jgi:hypothetical protein